MKLNFLLPAVFLTTLFSCSTDDRDEPLGSYDNGILVLNEGGIAEFTYVSNDLSVVQQDVFATVNGSSNDLGQYAQSVFFDGDRAFVISGSNKITVVNRYTMEYVTTISTGLEVPRYGTVVNGKAYVTNQADFFSSSDDFVAVIDLSDYSTETPIALNNLAERITSANGKLFVSGGAFGSGNVISVVDLQTNQVTSIAVGEAPNSMEVRDNMLYVLCGSFSSNSKLVKINTTSNQITEEIVFPDSMLNAANLDLEGNSMYFTVGQKIYKFPVNIATVADSPLVNTNSTAGYIGYGFAVNGGRIYISEPADDFSSDGKALIYDTSGTFIQEIQTGLGPNGFYFN